MEVELGSKPSKGKACPKSLFAQHAQIVLKDTRSVPTGHMGRLVGRLAFRRPRSLIESPSDSMKHIWSPWRMAYIENHNQEPGCLLCNRLAEADGPQNLILHRARHAFVILNRFPYTNGHMMIVPFAHRASLEDLGPDALAELMLLSSRALAVLRQAYGAEAFNLGANIGEAAGAGVVGHVHLHVLPRWPGDTNFMTTTADTRVVPSSLESTYERLHKIWMGLKGRE